MVNVRTPDLEVGARDGLACLNVYDLDVHGERNTLLAVDDVLPYEFPRNV